MSIWSPVLLKQFMKNNFGVSDNFDWYGIMDGMLCDWLNEAGDKMV